jgi:hypothetical protein
MQSSSRGIGPAFFRCKAALRVTEVIGYTYILVVGNSERVNSVHYHQYVWASFPEVTCSRYI